MAAGYEALDALIARLATAPWKDRDPIKAELQQLASGFPDRKATLDHLETAKRELQELEVRWEVEEVIEKLTPPPPAPAKKPEDKDKNKALSAADLTLVYDDPRGLLLHKTKVGERWFATQRDPRSGQPQTFELRTEEVTQLKTQLAGSPYWVLGRRRVIAALLALVGCGPSVNCPTAETALADGLTCGVAHDAVDYVELLAGRPVGAGDAPLALAAVLTKYRADPKGTIAWLEELRTQGAELAAMTGPPGAETRATRVWSADHGEDLIGAGDGDLWGVQQRALSVWAKDDQEKIAVTESDMEAWIRYASLCREVQGGGVLRISVADRVTVYQSLIDRFKAGDRAAKIAIASLGPVWGDVRDRWAAASYDQQQAWIQAAPLPPPMTATSLGYAQAIFASDVAHHVEVLSQQLGPFTVGKKERFDLEGH